MAKAMMETRERELELAMHLERLHPLALLAPARPPVLALPMGPRRQIPLLRRKGARKTFAADVEI